MDHRHLFTECVHGGVEPEPITGAIMTPIFQTSTFVQDSPGKHKGYEYSRSGNPTRTALESSLAILENAAYGLAFSSGLAAEQAIIQMLTPPCHVLVCDDVYGGTGRLFRQLFAKYQMEFEFLDMTDVDFVKSRIRPDTKMIWLETPTNPTLKIFDIAAISALKKNRDLFVVVDNTFASPIFQRPLDLGADLVVHSSTKYLGGHSDLIGGTIMTSNTALYEKLKFIQFACGSVSSPFECFLLLRSIKTLGIRMKQHAANALRVAQFLEEHRKIKKVYFPGLSSHPQHEVAKKQMSGFSGIVSFDWAGSYSELETMIRRLKLFALAESLGGVESLINHPEKMTHASVPEAMRKKLGINETLVRLSVGIEDANDLIQDLEQAFHPCP